MNRAVDGLLVDGVLLRREAIALGLDDEWLTLSVKSGMLVRIRQGAYADRLAWDRMSERAKGATLAVAVRRIYGPPVMISHSTAVLHHGGPTWGLDLRTVDITSETGSGRVQAAVRHHRGMIWPDDVWLPDDTWVTSPTRTVLEASVQARSLEIGVALASDFLHRGLTTPEQLADTARIVRSRQGGLLIRTVLALADARLESVAESRCWLILNRWGLPPVAPQYQVADPSSGFVAFLDFAIPHLGVWVEFDGREKYERYRRSGESLHEYLIRERRRENRVRELTGWAVIRLTWADLDAPRRVIERIWAVAQRQAS